MRSVIRRRKVKIPESQKKDGKEAREGNPALARLWHASGLHRRLSLSRAAMLFAEFERGQAGFGFE